MTRGAIGGRSIAGGVALSDEQRLAWLRLTRSENVGPAGIRAQMHQGYPCRRMNSTKRRAARKNAAAVHTANPIQTATT